MSRLDFGSRDLNGSSKADGRSASDGVAFTRVGRGRPPRRVDPPWTTLPWREEALRQRLAGAGTYMPIAARRDRRPFESHVVTPPYPVSRS
jgi:hypothetical protein